MLPIEGLKVGQPTFELATFISYYITIEHSVATIALRRNKPLCANSEE